MTQKEIIKKNQLKIQNKKCFYCGLEGDVRKNYKSQLNEIGKIYFRDRKNKTDGKRTGGRGQSLELERKKSKGHYSVDNCVLACYPCNNAKSDVFTCDEFQIIGAIIGGLKNHDKLKKMKKNKFIQGLMNDVKKRLNNNGRNAKK